LKAHLHHRLLHCRLHLLLLALAVVHLALLVVV
jgi:hypothetical protein